MTHKPYKVSDVDAVMSRGEWKSWDDMLTWLREEGEGDNELRADEVHHMIGDFERVKDSGAAFATEPQRAYELAQGNT